LPLKSQENHYKLNETNLLVVVIACLESKQARKKERSNFQERRHYNFKLIFLANKSSLWKHHQKSLKYVCWREKKKKKKERRERRKRKSRKSFTLLVLMADGRRWWREKDPEVNNALNGKPLLTS